MVDARGLCSFVCKHAPGRTTRHLLRMTSSLELFHVLAYQPRKKEPVCLTRLDGKRPDCLTLVSWCAGKPLTWDVTVVITLADSYLDSAAREAGAQAEHAAVREKANNQCRRNVIFSNQSRLKILAF